MEAYDHRATGLAERAPGPKMNYVELIQQKTEFVFGNKSKADTWLTQPKVAFGGSTPLELSSTEEGYELVKAELERLSHGFAC